MSHFILDAEVHYLEGHISHYKCAHETETRNMPLILKYKLHIQRSLPTMCFGALHKSILGIPFECVVHL